MAVRVCPSTPSPGPTATALQRSHASSTGATASARSRPSSSAGSARLIDSIEPTSTAASSGAGTPRVTSPAPARTAARPARMAAPALPGDPATTSRWPKSPLCAAAARARQQPGELLAGEQLEVAVRLLDERGGHAQVGHRHIAAGQRGRRQHVRHLERGEGHRELRSHVGARRQVRAGVEPARQVDREHRCAEGAQALDRRREEARERAGEPGAEERVDDQVAAAGRGEGGAQSRLVPHLLDLQRQRAADGELARGLLADGAPAVDQPDPRRASRAPRGGAPPPARRRRCCRARRRPPRGARPRSARRAPRRPPARRSPSARRRAPRALRWPARPPRASPPR